MDSYDPQTDSWLTEPSMNLAREGLVTWFFDGKLYAAGGWSGSTSFDIIEVYDPESNSWSISGTIPEPRTCSGLTIHNGKVYIIGGKPASGVYSNKVFAADLNASVAGVYDLYRKDGNASAGTPVVQAEVADGSVTASKMADGAVTASKIASKTIGKDQISDSILKYLKPEITSQPQASTIYAGGDGSVSFSAEGKYLTYQWKKDGLDLAGETNATLNITDANATLHDGNYSVVVSNDFGSVESGEILVDMNTTWSTDGLVGWWKFDEGSGTVAYDSSGNGNNGNLTNGPTWTNGKIGGALSFDGVDDFVQISNMQSLFSNAASFTTWVKVTDFSSTNSQGLAEFGATNGNLHYQFVGDMKIYMNILRSTNRVEQIASLTDTSEWHLLSITTQNGGDWVMFQNFSEAKRVLAQNLSLPLNQTFGRSIHSNTSYRYLKGFLDDVLIYDRALSAAEVQALYNMGQ